MNFTAPLTLNVPSDCMSLTVGSGIFGFWCNPLIGVYEKHGGNVGTALAALSVLLAVTLIVLVCSTRWLLPGNHTHPSR